MKIASRTLLRKMSIDFPTAAVGSSQAPTATVEKPSGASNTKIQTAPGNALPPITRAANPALKLGRLTLTSRGIPYFCAKAFILSNSLSAMALTTGLSTPVSALLTTRSGQWSPALITLMAALNARFTQQDESLLIGA